MPLTWDGCPNGAGVRLQGGPVPATPIGGRIVRAVQELQQSRIGVVRGADGLVRQQELPELRAVERAVRPDRVVGEASGSG